MNILLYRCPARRRIGKRVRFPRGPAAVISRAVSIPPLEFSGKGGNSEDPSVAAISQKTCLC